MSNDMRGFKRSIISLSDCTRQELARIGETAFEYRRSPQSSAGAGLAFDGDEIEALNNMSDGHAVRQPHYVSDAPYPVDAVYTTRWRSMGVATKIRIGFSDFKQFVITENTKNKFSGSSGAMFIHDMPAVRGQEVSADALDRHTSLVSRQSFHKALVARLRCFGRSGKEWWTVDYA
jgi:ornithine carbamoyltransferase